MGRTSEGRPGHGPVVVAVGDDPGGRALDWAAAEAAARGCRLLVFHAERLRWAVDPSGLVPVADFASYRAAADHILRAAVDRVRSVAPDLDVCQELGLGPTVPLLLSRSRGAQLLVLGRPAVPFPFRRLRGLLGCGRVAGRALCPVAVVGSLPSGPQAGSSPRVVVGIDARGSGAAALGVAFRSAAQRGVPLTVVHGWTPDVPAGHDAVCGSFAASEARADQYLHRALEPWRSRFPDVPVIARLTAADPAAVLTREAEGAALVVVGSRGRRMPGARPGSVGRRVAERAGCPVVVVRTGEPPGERHAARGRRGAAPAADPRGTASLHRRGTTWG